MATGKFKAGIRGAVLWLSVMAGSTAMAQGAAGPVLSGKISSGVNGKPVENVQVFFPELRISTASGKDGAYSLAVPKAGTYTIIVNSAEFTVIKTSVDIRESTVRDFVLSPLRARGGITVTGMRDIQKVARYTMTSAQMKEVPASFGDSVSALTSLPGVLRTDGFFGQLVIRGVEPNLNRYFIDDIPIYNPLHFGGLHSVISNDLMSEIDLYGSSFPAQFGGAIGAIININTIDNVKEFGGVVDIGILSSNFILKMPIRSSGDEDSPEPENRNRGYWIAAGRYGYLSLVVPPVYKLITGDTLESIPEYWDYQVKAKYAFNNRHSVSMLLMGSRDYLKFIGERTPDEEVDPLLSDFKFKNDLTSNSGGLYYTWKPVREFSSTLLGYYSLSDSRNYISLENPDAADALKDINIISKPYIFGAKEKVKWEWWKRHAELRTAAEAAEYMFMTDGSTVAVTRDIYTVPDYSDDTLFRKVALGRTILNRTLGGYAENRFTFGGLTLMPGVRADYLERSGDVTVDPRGMASYEFPTGTTLSLAGGRYSYFVQTNPYAFNWSPLIASRAGFRPERSWQRAAGVEQKISLVTLKLEGFYNTYYDLFEVDPILDAAGNVLQEGKNTGRQKTHGIEITLRLDREEGAEGLFGWINYTYTRSTRKSGVSDAADDPFNDANRYVTFAYEQAHALKLVAGYTFGKHTLSSRFQLYSSFPYTPITGSEESPAGSGRYVPTYYGAERNSKHFPMDHRLDLRYSYRTVYSWGQVSWYVEIINAYNHRSITEETWSYQRAYGTDNPRIEASDEGLTLMPNFGVEIKF